MGQEGNGSVVTSLVEFSLDAGATWSLRDTTKRASIAASGFKPGVPAWFRVVATGRAEPSAAASVHAPAPMVELKPAA